jgi:hypothetical protein
MEGTEVWILLVNRRSKLGIHAKTLGTVLYLYAQADTRGATQVLDCGGQAVTRGSCLSRTIDRGAGSFARRAISCASQGTSSWCPGR